MIGKTGSSVPVVVMQFVTPHGWGRLDKHSSENNTPTSHPSWQGRLGRMSQWQLIRQLALCVTPHGREDWVKCPSDINVPIYFYTPHGRELRLDCVFQW